jgi:crotonobetainyl-CoA:carnitine CoA-transferase CaiB-like acyl-CoA transferase
MSSPGDAQRIEAAGSIPEPLEDVLVVDASAMMPGQLTTMFLGDFGARVIKVERPGSGDFSRSGIPGTFESVNRNKEAITLDLKHAEGVEVLHRLVARADVFVEGWRPGVADRLGAGYETLSRVRPRLIYCSLSSFGQTGPYRDLPGHDPDFLATAGVLSLAGDPDGPPEGVLGASMADLSGAWFSVIAILVALRARDRSGIGQRIDMALGDAAFALLQSRLVEYLVNERPDKSTLMSRPGLGLFASRDGRHLTIGAIEDHFWRTMCEVAEIAQWGASSRFATSESRRKHGREIRHRLREAFLQRDRDAWIDALQAAGVPCARVNDLEEALEDPHTKARGIVEWLQHPEIGDLPQVRFPGILSATPARMRVRPPLLGEHTDAVLAEIGYGADDIETLHRSNVV